MDPQATGTFDGNRVHDNECANIWISNGANPIIRNNKVCSL